jgi:peptidoglycan-N-acetylmuramic acid deacetylase
MTDRLKTWLITGGVSLALAAGAILSGFAIANMTRKEAPAEQETEESGNAENPTDYVVPTAPDAPTADHRTEEPETLEPASQEPSGSGAPSEDSTPASPDEPVTDPSVPDSPSGIHALTAGDLAAIRGQFTSDQKHFYAGGVAADDGRPISCNKFEELFNALYGQAVHVYQSDRSTVALTFILVNEYGLTDTVLDSLSSLGVAATFFVNRNYAEKNPAIIRRIIDEGHTLGSLGANFTDSGFSSMSLEDQMDSALSLQNYIKELYGYDMKYFNYVHDDYTEQSLSLLTQMGCKVVYYSVKFADYDPKASINADEFLDTMKRWAHPGAVYNFHTTNQATLNVVPQLISYLREKGYTVGPLN